MDKEKCLKEGKLLPLMEDFYTIQGEGFHTGKPAYFVRIGGCDIGCSWCDTKLSWNTLKFAAVPADDIVRKVLDKPAKAVVVTGGEPLMYPLDYFTRRLKEHDIETFLETSGAYTLSGRWDWICFSPKQNQHPLPDIFDRADELKVIIQNKEDLHWAEVNSEKVGKNCYLFLQPEWSVAPRMMPVIIDYVKANPHWRISLQAHKYMKIP